ncbi:Ras-related protein Rab-32 [Tritrichomonas foetus]|uniref:Ras-related protein Rab n=1 Tax=Tritrichomonas foetus TaxID=1144522 RepID=A0A1J4KBF4_9EUKA|nr:Ras-related protein Rab-32 [Tritrichomonas foetus]|eukprot:OHT08745.1 Ras-related protein Rab-32 [Tritrichomonas foetus]
MNLDEGESNTVKKVLKVLVVGDMGTGKTSLIRQFVSGFFSEFYKSTIGVDFAHKPINWDENTIVDLQLWDISGQERFGKVTHMYYQEAVGSLIIFDLTKIETLEIASFWKSDIDEKVLTTQNNPIPCLLIGNKSDLVKSFEWGRTKEEMDEFCKQHGFIGFFETSAREGTNVEESIRSLVKFVLDNSIEPYHPDTSNCVQLDEQPKKTKSCCK